MPDPPKTVPTILTDDLKEIVMAVLELRERARESKHFHVTDKIRNDLSRYWGFEICDKRKEWLFCGGNGEKVKGSFAGICNVCLTFGILFVFDGNCLLCFQEAPREPRGPVRHVPPAAQPPLPTSLPKPPENLTKLHSATNSPDLPTTLPPIPATYFIIFQFSFTIARKHLPSNLGCHRLSCRRLSRHSLLEPPLHFPQIQTASPRQEKGVEIFGNL